MRSQKLYDTGEDAKPRHVGFRLKRPGTTFYAFGIHFTGYGIFLQGDLSPVRSGGFGCHQHKTLGWFLGELVSRLHGREVLGEGLSTRTRRCRVGRLDAGP